MKLLFPGPLLRAGCCRRHPSLRTHRGGAVGVGVGDSQYLDYGLGGSTLLQYCDRQGTGVPALRWSDLPGGQNMFYWTLR